MELFKPTTYSSLTIQLYLYMLLSICRTLQVTEKIAKTNILTAIERSATELTTHPRVGQRCAGIEPATTRTSRQIIEFVIYILVKVLKSRDSSCLPVC